MLQKVNFHISLVVLATLSVLIMWPLSSPAEERGTADEAHKLVKKAVDFYAKNGQAKALAEFNNPKGLFLYKDLYIWTENEGVTTAHPKTPGLVGKNWLTLKDAKGRLFVQEIIKVAKAQGKGTVEYAWTHPETKKIEDKIAYVEKVPVPNDHTIIVCGYYK